MSLEDYEVVPTRPISPLHLFLEAPREQDTIGVVFDQVAERTSMQAFAAARCFFKMGVPQLQKIMELLQLPPIAPPDLFMILAALVDDILHPGPEEFERIMRHRAEYLKGEKPQVDLETLAPAMDPKDFEEAEARGHLTDEFCLCSFLP